MPFTRRRLIAPDFFSHLTHCSGARCPTLPPTPAYIRSFEQQIVNKVHMDLVLQRGQPAPTAAACPFTEHSRLTKSAPLLKVRVASALAKEGLALSLPSELVDGYVIITGKNTRCKSSRNTKQSLELTTQTQSSQREKVSTLMNPKLYALLACCRPSRNTIES